MSVVINGDTGISGVNGSAGNPAIKGGDADTGIHFGTDTAAITTGGTDKVSIDSSGDATFSGTVKTSKVENANTSNGGVEIDTAGHVQVDGVQMPGSGARGFKNLIINSLMRQTQRGVNHYEKTGSDYYLDRWNVHVFTMGAAIYNVERVNDAPPGFYHSQRISVHTADASPDANHQMFLQQHIEGKNIQHLNFFTANPDNVTISFYVRSNRTGSYSAGLKLADNGSSFGSGDTRIYNFTYSISAANTWERKTFSLALDSATAHTRTLNNAMGMSLLFWLSAGTSRDGATPNVWTNNGNSATASDNLDLLTSTSNNWSITGVQIELGNKATEVEVLDTTTEQLLCRRYLQAVRSSRYMPHLIRGSNANSASTQFYPLPVPMRSTGSGVRQDIPNLRNFNGFNSAGSTTLSDTASYIASGDGTSYKFNFSDITNISNNELQVVANYSASHTFLIDAEIT